jgi:hypothetical protein
VSEFHPPRRRTTLSDEGLGARASVRFALATPDGDGARTRVTVVHEQAGWVGGTVAWVTGHTIEAHLKTLAGDLKKHCETRRRAGDAARVPNTVS